MTLCDRLQVEAFGIEKMKGTYTLIVPSLARTGPVNVAVDLGSAASACGWSVQILYLSNKYVRDDLTFAVSVRRFHVCDLWRINGVVHTHCLRPDLLGMLLKFNRNITLITTIHNNFLDDLLYSYNKLYVYFSWMIWKYSLRGFDAVVCISESMRYYYSKEIKGLKLDVVYNFRASHPSGSLNRETKEWISDRKDAGDMVLSFVGVLTELKNIYGLVSYIINAKSISLIICGNGPLREPLKKLIIDHGLHNKIRLEGHVNIPALVIQCTDALILPSHTEGFPLVVIEAASVGVPSLLSDIPVHRELEELGFGITFDHINFTNVESAALNLKEFCPTPNEALVNLWHSQFTPLQGFKMYELIFTRKNL